jgi:hypothetical protein
MMRLNRQTHGICVLALLQFITNYQTVAQASTRPLDRGIKDVETIIERDRQLKEALQEAVKEHVQNLGEIIYESYGQDRDPAVRLIHLKNAYEAVHSATLNGVTGQVWPAIGQLGQALLDYWSEANPTVKNINAFQQLVLEAARLKTIVSELSGYDEAIKRNSGILNYLENRSAEIANARGQSNSESKTDVASSALDDPVLPVIPSGSDLSALDDAISLERWFDLGNRAFQDKSAEDSFYKRFPVLQRFRTVAETYSPRTEVDRFTAVCGTGDVKILDSGAEASGASSTAPSFGSVVNGVVQYLQQYQKNGFCPENKPR